METLREAAAARSSSSDARLIVPLYPLFRRFGGVTASQNRFQCSIQIRRFSPSEAKFSTLKTRWDDEDGEGDPAPGA
jgi:hypothetical protein